MATANRFEVGKKYRYEEILGDVRGLQEADFTGKRNGKPVLKVTVDGQSLEFIKDGKKYRLV